MKTMATFVLLAMMFPSGVVAVEPDIKMAAKDHALGRVFMSNAERRQLDLLRKSIPPAIMSGPVSATSQSTTAVTKKKPNAVGFIVPSNGAPYQWIDGDFRRVPKADINLTIISKALEITRHERGSTNDGQNPDEHEQKSSGETSAAEAEAGNENRNP